MRGALPLALVCAAALLPGLLSLPVVDRDEARFAQASRQMAGGKSWRSYVVPQLQDRPRINKPPLTYWLQSTAARLAGEIEQDPWRSYVWPYRLPSALAAALAVIAIWRLGREMFGEPSATLAGVLLATSPMLMWEARQARADAILLATVTFAQLRLWRVWQSSHTTAGSTAAAGTGRDAAWFWTAVAAAALTKGPVGPAICALTIAALCFSTRQWRWIAVLQPVRGVALAAAPLLLWWTAVGIAVGWEPLATTLRDEYLTRALAPREGHGGPPGYHAVLVWALCWPAGLLILPGLWNAWRAISSPQHEGATDPLRFLLAWLAPAWLLFELAGTKLPHYVLPLYPALVLLAVRTPVEVAARFLESRWCRAGFAAWLATGALLGVLLPWIPLLFGAGSIRSAAIAAAASATAAMLLLATRRFALRHRFAEACIAAAGVPLCAFAATTPLLSNAEKLHVSQQLVRHLAVIDPVANRPLAAVDHHEDSLVFLSRGRAERIADEDLRAWSERHPRGILIVSAERASALPHARELARVAGWNYSKGRRVELRIVER